MEPALLYPVRHGSEEAQQDLLRIKLGDSLVRARVGLINSLRFTLKSLSYTIANPSTERFHKVVQGAVPESVLLSRLLFCCSLIRLRVYQTLSRQALSLRLLI